MQSAAPLQKVTDCMHSSMSLESSGDHENDRHYRYNRSLINGHEMSSAITEYRMDLSWLHNLKNINVFNFHKDPMMHIKMFSTFIKIE